MAINLKMKKKCHIVPPDWLSVGARMMSKPFGGGLLTRGNRFSSGKIDTGDKPPRVQSVSIPLYRNSEATS
jgi:hypothetical protein